MRIACISTHNRKGITKGSLYDVIEGESTNVFYAIKNDFGDFSLYPRKLFKSIAEIRSSKIDAILLPTEFIFDTNVYRNLVHDISMGEVISLAEKLQRAELALGYSSASSIVVIMELLQHLLEGDPARVDCYKALCMLFYHTSKIDDAGKTRIGNYYPPINILLAQIFFNQNSKYKALYDKVNDLFIELVKHHDVSVCKKFENEIKAIRSQILFEKSEFKDNVENFLASLNGGVLDWQYINKNKTERERFFEKVNSGDMAVLLAWSLALRAHIIMDATQLIQDINERFQKFFSEYYAAILMNLTLMESIGRGAEKLKDVSDDRWNTLNDVQIMFAMLFFKNGFHEKVLVTEEKKIKESAIKAGIGENVFSIADYKKMINFAD